LDQRIDAISSNSEELNDQLRSIRQNPDALNVQAIRRVFFEFGGVMSNYLLISSEVESVLE
jgi:hypothetical protein